MPPCPLCHARLTPVAGIADEVRLPAVSRVTFTDGDGERHDHSGDCVLTVWRCPSGHEVEYTTTVECWCGWRKE